MASHHFLKARRVGATYLEIQVAMVMLALGMAGLYSMTVVQTRQASRLQSQLPPDDNAALNSAATNWHRKLGVYASIEAAVVTNPPVGPKPPLDIVVDNADGAPAFTHFHNPADTYGWNDWTYGGSYLGNTMYHRSDGNVGSWVEYKANVPPGNYEVYTTFPGLTSLGTNIEYQLFDSAALITSEFVNQTVHPSDLTYGGETWKSLGTYTVNSGELRVRLLDSPGATNYIIADAILISERPSLSVVSVTETANGAQAVLETAP